MKTKPPMTRVAKQGTENLDWWNAAWLGAVALCAGVLLATGANVTGAALMALAVMAVPAALGLVLLRWRSDSAEPVWVFGWGLCGALAALFTGGVAGPLAIWVLAPLAAAAALASPRRLALGVAIAVGSLGLTVLAGWALVLPEPPDFVLAQALGVTGLLTLGVGLGVGLVLLHRRVDFEQYRAQRSELAMQQALAEQPDLLVSLNRDGLLTGAWGQAGQVLRENLAPRRHISLVARAEDRPALDIALAQALDTGASAARFGLAGGEDQSQELSLRRVGADKLVGAIRDIRPQLAREHLLEEARAEAEAQNAGKSRFLANMSHELRTPLNAIMGFADIMKQRLFGPLPDRYGEYPELIHESGSHLLELINDVLDMSKIEAERYELNLEEFDARDAVNAVLRLMRGQADRAGVNLRGMAPRHELEVLADRRALKQIALNLISNALKFTPKGGAITVTVRGTGEMLELAVVDTGVGIAEADLTRIGSPYEQAGDVAQKNAGTGLGLSLVRAFAELHGGEMRIESKLGEGTKVTVRMPVMVVSSAGEPEPKAEAIL